MVHRDNDVETGQDRPPAVDCSIIIPAYNAAGFLEESVADALGQCALTVEVLVIDDGSTDDTSTVMGRLADPRLTYRRQDQNGGPARARNAGLALARGRWVAIFDADDRMGPNRLSTLIARAEAENLDLVADNLWVAEGLNRRLHIAEDLDGRLTRLSLVDMFDSSRMGQKKAEYGYLKPIFRRAFITRHGLKYNESMRIGEDLMFVAECLVRGGRYGRVASSEYTYVRHDNSISHRLKPGQIEAIEAADRDFLVQHDQRLSPSERASVALHRRSLNNAGAYIRMLEALKGRSIFTFAREVLRRPAAILYFQEPVEKRLTRLWARIRSRSAPADRTGTLKS